MASVEGPQLRVWAGLDILFTGLLERLVQGFLHGVQPGGQLDWLVRVPARETQFALVILDLHLDELEAVRR